MILTGGSHRERSDLLADLRSRASGQGWLCLGLQADALDRRAPYGVVQEVVELLRPHLQSEDGWASPLAGLVALAGVSARSTAREGSAPSPTRSERLFGTRTDALPRAEEVRAELTDLITSRAQKSPLLVTLSPGEFIDPASRDFFGELSRQLAHLPLALVVSLSEADREAHESWRRGLGPGVVHWERAEPSSTGPSPRLRPQAEGLDPPSRRLLACVAAAGPDATLALMRASLAWTDVQVEQAARPPEEAGILLRDRAHLALAEPGAQGELLRLLPPSEVRSLHASIARALKGTHPRPEGKLIYRMAEHWAAAEVPEEAARALLAAGHESTRRGAHEEAELELRRALVLAQSVPGPEGRELEERVLASLGISMEMQGSPSEAISLLERAIRTCQERKGGVERWGPYLCRESRLVTEVGPTSGSIDERMVKALDEADRRKLPEVAAELHASLAHRLLLRGVYAEGKEHALRSVELADRGKDLAILARALRMAALAWGMGTGGGDPEARALLVRLVGMRPEEAGVEYPFALDDLSTLACGQHQEKEAVEFGKRSVEQARRICSRSDLLLMLGNHAEHLLHYPDLEAASRVLLEIKQLSDRYHLPEGHSVRQQWMLIEGLRLRLAGDRVAARRQLEATVSLGERLGARDIMGQSLAYLVVLSVEMGDHEGARAYLRRLEREGLRRTLFSTYLEMLDGATAKIPPKG